MKKMVIKVNVTNEKQQQNVLRAVSNLPGIKNLAVDREKGTLTVTGSIDPVCVIKKLRKCRKYAEIDSIAAEKKDEKKDDDKKKECPPCLPYPYYYAPCSPYVCHVEESNSCVIL